MTTIDPFDPVERRITDAIRKIAAARTPDYLDSALQLTAGSRQLPRWALPQSWHLVNRYAIAAGGAMLTVALALVALGLTGSTKPSVGGSPSPVVSPSHESFGPPLPAALQHAWIGGARAITGILPGAGISMTLDGRTLRLAQPDQPDQALFASTALINSAGLLRLQATSVQGGCAVGDVGRYRFAVSTDGRQLTLTPDTDACAERQAGVSGAWQLSGCKRTDELCLGLMDAGTYGSQYFATHQDPGGGWTPQYGRLTFTVPDGWAVSYDFPNAFRLVSATEYATETASTSENIGVGEVIEVVSHVGRPSTNDACSEQADPSTSRTYADLAFSIRFNPRITVTNEQTLLIDGMPTTSFDLALAPSWTGGCSALLKPSVTLVAELGQGIVLVGAEHIRLFLIDTPGGDVAAVAIHAPDAASLDPFAAATAIVETFQLR